MENRMGTEPVRTLVLKMGLPLLLSLLINSLYNFVDSIFVSRISESALTGLSLSAPVQTLISSLGLGNAVGLNAAVSRALGEKNEREVRDSTSASLMIAVFSWVLIAVLCLLGLRGYFQWQSNGNAEIAAYGRTYLSICMLLSLGQMFQWVFDRLVIASGRSSLFLFTLSAASVTNLILDPIFIFGYLGFPAMGVAGAALATVIGQHVGAVAGYFINCRFNREIPVHFTLHPNKKSIAAILRVGIPSGLVQAITSFIGVFMNSVLIGFSTTAVAVFGVCNRLQGVVTVGVHGINNGLIPIVAYNYGARKRERIGESVKWAVLYSVLLYGIVFLVLEIFPEKILALFDASASMQQIGIPALRILAASYFVSIFSLVIAAALQGLGLGQTSMYLTLLRQVVLPVLLILLLKNTGSLPAVWGSFVLAEILAMPVAFRLWKNVAKG